MEEGNLGRVLKQPRGAWEGFKGRMDSVVAGKFPAFLSLFLSKKFDRFILGMGKVAVSAKSKIRR